MVVFSLSCVMCGQELGSQLPATPKRAWYVWPSKLTCLNCPKITSNLLADQLRDPESGAKPRDDPRNGSQMGGLGWVVAEMAREHPMGSGSGSTQPRVLCANPRQQGSSRVGRTYRVLTFWPESTHWVPYGYLLGTQPICPKITSNLLS